MLLVKDRCSREEGARRWEEKPEPAGAGQLGEYQCEQM